MSQILQFRSREGEPERKVQKAGRPVEAVVVFFSGVRVEYHDRSPEPKAVPVPGGRTAESGTDEALTA